MKLTIARFEYHENGSLKSVTFNPLLAAVYGVALGVLVDVAIRVWEAVI